MSAARTMLAGIYEHGRFANGRLLDRAEHLSDDALDAERPGMFGTIRSTLLHMMQAQHSWLRRVQGLDPVEPWTLETFPTIADLRNRWNALDAENLAYLATLTDDQLMERVHLRSWAGWEMTAPRWQALVHQAFHQHQHRGELALVLTNLGYSPGELDGFDWFEAEGTAVDITPDRAAPLPD
ncbi:MAG: DinB family protein [Thermomicrobiales bacterium]|nr:DinB family protein [Thermomicrobiales bacterium]MCO5222591.1 DinB family protein [Thermomicrobiales bacterium]